MLCREAILAALATLDEELSTVDVRADIFVVRGTAMAVAYETRRSTDDVDAVFVPPESVRRAARRVADRLSLPEDWLNDGAKAFMPGGTQIGSSSSSVPAFRSPPRRRSTCSP
jgi:hypothetical protein